MTCFVQPPAHGMATGSDLEHPSPPIAFTLLVFGTEELNLHLWALSISSTHFVMRFVSSVFVKRGRRSGGERSLY